MQRQMTSRDLGNPRFTGSLDPVNRSVRTSFTRADRYDAIQESISLREVSNRGSVRK